MNATVEDNFLAEADQKARADAALSPVIQFDLSQRAFFDDRSRVIIVNSALETKKDWFIVSLTQRQADATFAKCLRVAHTVKRLLKMQGELKLNTWEFEEFDKELDQRFQFKAREIVLPNGARIVSLPGRDPDTLAGLTGNIIFTEFGLFPNGGYNHWSVIFPITTRGFQVCVISTPRGKNTKFYELWIDNETYSVHTCDIYQSVSEEGFVLQDNNGQPCTIEQFRRLYNDEGKWPREYECKFTGDLESLIKWAQLEEAAALSDGLPFSFVRVEKDGGWDAGFFRREMFNGGRLEVGWDVARTGHLSALWANLAMRNRPTHLRSLVIMHNTSFALMRAVVCSAMDACPGSVGCGDSTGLGMESNETLAFKYRERWEGINFGGGRKKELASGLATAFGDHTQTIPPMDSPYKFIATDIYAIQKDDTGGTLKLDEADNALMPESHCDIAWSGALARLAASKNYRPHLPSPLKRKPVGW
jgi:phage FluMu gp28-like protein